MAIQKSVAARNASLDSLETTVGTTPVMKLFTGSMPANCAAADTGTVLATLTLPSDWMANASSGTKAKSGTWQDLTADNSGSFGYFRIYESTATTCHLQGTAGTSGDLVTDSASVTAGQAFTVTAFTLTAGNA